MPIHRCNRTINGRKWERCAACNGRVYLPVCTTKKHKKKDCCRARHEDLHASGQTVGVNDSSLDMLEGIDSLD